MFFVFRCLSVSLRGLVRVCWREKKRRRGEGGGGSTNLLNFLEKDEEIWEEVTYVNEKKYCVYIALMHSLLFF